jgi:KaiC/GvpD/RAD55 family RecA-like ATPase
MRTHKARIKAGRTELEKTSTGIAGLDEIANGGLPTSLCGAAGCGKTLLVSNQI